METKAAYSQPLYSPNHPPATPLPLSRSLALPVLFCHLLYIRDILLVRRVSRKNCENSPVHFLASLLLRRGNKIRGKKGEKFLSRGDDFPYFSGKIRIRAMRIFVRKLVCLIFEKKLHCSIMSVRKIHLFAFDSSILWSKRNSPRSIGTEIVIFFMNSLSRIDREKSFVSRKVEGNVRRFTCPVCRYRDP